MQEENKKINFKKMNIVTLKTLQEQLQEKLNEVNDINEKNEIDATLEKVNRYLFFKKKKKYVQH